MAAASAALVESLGIPNVRPSEYTKVSHHTGEAESFEQQKEDHKQNANAPKRRETMGEREVDAAKARASRSKNAADRSSDETWRIIQGHDPHRYLSREAYEASVPRPK